MIRKFLRYSRSIERRKTMRRRKISKRTGRKQFRNAAAKNIAKNISAKPRRGGIRM